MLGSGNGASYAVYNKFENTGTGAKIGVRNEFADVQGNKYGVYNTVASGTSTGQIYGVYNEFLADGNATKHGTYTYISGGDGQLRGSYNSIHPASTNTSIIYGVYGFVSSAGTGTHYGGYFSAAGDNNRAVYGSNSASNGWAGYFSGNGFWDGNLIFNESGTSDHDFRIESDTRVNMFLLDASDDIVRVGNDLSGDSDNGVTLNGVVVDYVADFDNGLWDGTAIGIGSIEYLLDGNSLTTINNNFAPATNGVRTMGTSSLRWSAVYAVNGTIQTSDASQKKNIHDLSYGLKEIMSLRPVSYQWKSDNMGKTPIAPNEKETKLGFVAQEVQDILPEIVQDKEWLPISEEKPEEFHLVPMEVLGMSYSEITPVIVKAIQEQQEIINTQHIRIQELERKIEEILRKN
jgi:hypothetical protein